LILIIVKLATKFTI